MGIISVYITTGINGYAINNAEELTCLIVPAKVGLVDGTIHQVRARVSAPRRYYFDHSLTDQMNHARGFIIEPNIQIVTSP